MSRQLVNVTVDNLSDLPDRCRSCVFWELDPAATGGRADRADAELEKEAWLSDILLEWGNCGQLVYVDDVAAGFVLYAPPAYVPRSMSFPTSPVSADAVLLMTGFIDPAYRGSGLARVLVRGLARETVRRGIRAIEAFGRTAAVPDRTAPGQDGDRSCLVPADYLRAVGFKTVRPHPRTPRLRLDIRSTVSWREDVESAWERLLGSMHAPVLSR